MDDPALNRFGDRFRPVRDEQLAENTFQVSFHGMLADLQGFADLLVRHALGHLFQHLHFPRRQVFENIPRGFRLPQAGTLGAKTSEENF